MDKLGPDRALSQARFLAWFSIGYNLVEAMVSGWFGLKEASLSLLGFGAEEALVRLTLLGVGLLGCWLARRRKTS